MFGAGEDRSDPVKCSSWHFIFMFSFSYVVDVKKKYID